MARGIGEVARRGGCFDVSSWKSRGPVERRRRSDDGWPLAAPGESSHRLAIAQYGLLLCQCSSFVAAQQVPVGLRQRPQWITAWGGKLQHGVVHGLVIGESAHERRPMPFARGAAWHTADDLLGRPETKRGTAPSVLSMPVIVAYASWFGLLPPTGRPTVCRRVCGVGTEPGDSRRATCLRGILATC